MVVRTVQQPRSCNYAGGRGGDFAMDESSGHGSRQPTIARPLVNNMYGTRRWLLYGLVSHYAMQPSYDRRSEHEMQPLQS